MSSGPKPLQYYLLLREALWVHSDTVILQELHTGHCFSFLYAYTHRPNLFNGNSPVPVYYNLIVINGNNSGFYSKLAISSIQHDRHIILERLYHMGKPL